MITLESAGSIASIIGLMLALLQICRSCKKK